MIYIKANYIKIIMGYFALLLFAFIFYLYGISWAQISYPLFICFLGLSLYFVLDFYFFNKKLKELNAMISEKNFDVKYIQANSPIEQKYIELINNMSSSHSNDINQLKQKNDANIDYLLLWSHQIKTPLSALNLMSQKLPNSSEYMEQLFYVDAYIDMMLQFLKLENINEDYRFEKFNIGDVIREVIRFFRPVFINSKTTVQLDNIDITVLSDKKLLSFVIKQIVSNAIKYSPKGIIKIYMESPNTLAVEDNGIGINAEDIPMLFKKGFTGYNGRQHQKSSGIGLFLSYEILSKINHNINISSKPGMGTVVKIFIN
ncbi:MAG: HAMP domain-containing histidine kinase [Christensenellaceae bacterium]|nr:HAMP domain-containing histidine kinase [Christensenellaceae bacterium]